MGAVVQRAQKQWELLQKICSINKRETIGGPLLQACTSLGVLAETDILLDFTTSLLRLYYGQEKTAFKYLSLPPPPHFSISFPFTSPRYTMPDKRAKCSHPLKHYFHLEH